MKTEISFRLSVNNDNLALRKEVNGYLYDVSYDCNAIYHVKDEFDNEKDYQAHIDKYNKCHFAYYIVEKFKKCSCCDSPLSEDCLSGIEADCADKALEYYLADYA